MPLVSPNRGFEVMGAQITKKSLAGAFQKRAAKDSRIPLVGSNSALAIQRRESQQFMVACYPMRKSKTSICKAIREYCLRILDADSGRRSSLTTKQAIDESGMIPFSQEFAMTASHLPGVMPEALGKEIAKDFVSVTSRMRGVLSQSIGFLRESGNKQAYQSAFPAFAAACLAVDHVWSHIESGFHLPPQSGNPDDCNPFLGVGPDKRKFVTLENPYAESLRERFHFLGESSEGESGESESRRWPMFCPMAMIAFSGPFLVTLSKFGSPDTETMRKSCEEAIHGIAALAGKITGFFNDPWGTC